MESLDFKLVCVSCCQIQEVHPEDFIETVNSEGQEEGAVFICPKCRSLWLKEVIENERERWE